MKRTLFASLALAAVATQSSIAFAEGGSEPPKYLEIARAPAANSAKTPPPTAESAPESQTAAEPQPAPPEEPSEAPRPEAADAMKLVRHASAAALKVATPVPAPPPREARPVSGAANLEFTHTLSLLRSLGQTAEDGLESAAELRKRFLSPLREGLLELAPTVADDAWDEALALMYDDKCVEALAKAGPFLTDERIADDPAMQYVRARMQMCASKSDRDGGTAAMKALAKGEGPTAILARRRLGEKVLVTDAEDVEGMYLSQRIDAAHALARRGKVEAALADLDSAKSEVTRRWDRMRLDYARAQVLETAKRYDEAGEVLLALYRTSSGMRFNDTVEDHIERLERRTKKRILTYGERIDRMRHLVARGRYKDAKEVSVENAKIKGVKGAEIRGWMYYRLALQAEREKERTKAVELFAKADKLVRDSEVRPRLYFGWARALRRLDRDAEAIGLYDKLVAEFAEHHLCDDALYEAGRLLQFQNEHARAVAKFDVVINKYPDGEFVGDALWRSAFSNYQTGKYDAAVGQLEKLRADHGTEKDESELTVGLKATYWLAMAQLKAGRLNDAERVFQETINRGPLTWYGRLAAARMQERGWTPSVRMPNHRLTKAELEDLTTLRVPHNPRLEVAEQLVRLGLWRDARDEMAQQVSIHPVPDGAHRLLAAIHLANGAPNHAHWIMKKQIAESGPGFGTLRDWGTAFPLDYMEHAHEYGTKFGVSPFLVQAIIRQESGFRPTVKSWAGAIGLMQLMPTTASYTYRKFFGGKGAKKFRTNDLKDAQKNVELGSMYIRIHTAHASESIPLALAGYNAGPGSLEDWFKRFGDRSLDEFVESITFQEARGYVRKVYTSYVTYAALYGGVLPELSLALPKTLRKFGEVPEAESKEAPAVSLLDL